MTTRSEVAELTARIVADRWTNGDERGRDWPEATWRALADAGLPWVGVDAEHGGSGGTLADACDVLWELGAGAVPVPVAETGVLAGWTLAAGGLTVPDGPTTLAVARGGDALAPGRGRSRLVTTLRRVPWAARASHVVVVCPGDDRNRVALVPTEAVAVTPGRNLAGEPRDEVAIDVLLDDEQVAVLPESVDAAAIHRRGALSRVALMAGAMERIATLTVGYTNDREQFGKAVIRFQAVAGLVVQLVEQAVAAATTARAAIALGDGAAFEIGIAKQQTSAAATIVAKLAHQAHGAIGMTAEYELGDLTRRLWCWRHEYGTEWDWAVWLGEQVVAGGADRLWPRIAQRAPA